MDEEQGQGHGRGVSHGRSVGRSASATGVGGDQRPAGPSRATVTPAGPSRGGGQRPIGLGQGPQEVSTAGPSRATVTPAGPSRGGGQRPIGLGQGPQEVSTAGSSRATVTPTGLSRGGHQRPIGLGQGRREVSTAGPSRAIVSAVGPSRGRDQRPAGLGQGRGEVSTVGPSRATVTPARAAPAPIIRNPPLLTQQEGHRSSLVLSGRELAPLVMRKHKIPKMWDDRFKDYLVRAGFYGVHQIGYVRSDKFLISALVERWRPETHSFHLAVGEMMVTLQDVAVLLGLPIDGEAIYSVDEREHDWPAMIREYLGRDVDEQTFRKGCKTAISISWLQREFEQNRCPENADDAVVQCYVRAYILIILSSVLFTDLSGNAISVKYLPFLRDLNKVGNYSWGSAVLAYLNRELCRTCHESAKQMGGPILLLQIWAWERFLFGRPKVRNGVPKPRLGGPVIEHRPPYGYLWSGYHDWTKNPGRVLDYYRDELDYLREYQINWNPYKERRLALLPPICTLARGLWVYTGPVIHFQVIEPHNPKRVMRQFGKHQRVPPNPSRTFDASPCGENKQVIGDDIARKLRHAEHVSRWMNRWEFLFVVERAYNPSFYRAYMEWYSMNTRLYLRPARSIGPLACDPRELLYQIRAGITHKAAERIGDMRKEAAKKMNEAAVDDATRAFARMMLTGLKDLMKILGEYDGSREHQEAPHSNVGRRSDEAESSRGKRLRGG